MDHLLDMPAVMCCRILLVIIYANLSKLQNNTLAMTAAIRMESKPSAGYHAVLDVSVQLQSEVVQKEWGHKMCMGSVILVFAIPGDIFFEYNELLVKSLLFALIVSNNCC